MNSTVYIFGQFGNGYNQYPNDYTATIFKTFYTRTREATQLGIHRDGNIMYYSYIRRLENDRYLGMCVVLNGLFINRVDPLFPIFEDLIAELVSMAQMLQFDNEGKIITPLNDLSGSSDDYTFITDVLQAAFARQEMSPLPPVDYSKAKDSTKVFTLNDDSEEITTASCQYAYTYIYKSDDYNARKLGTYLQTLTHLNEERQNLQNKCDELAREVKLLKRKQRNFTWVILLVVVIAGLVGILWNQVLYPSEVTHYETGEFVYYGPMSNRKPHGIGVALYPEDDPQGRRFYIGRFCDGERQDTAAMLFYKDGSYFKGSMKENEWEKGIFFDVEEAHFVGEFHDNIPWNGAWYKHEKVQTITNGKAN